MAVQIIDRPITSEETFKAREVEGVLDRYFYRKLGFWLAKFFARLNVTPAKVSLVGGLCGVIGGHLYYYRSVAINAVGMVLHVSANTLDNADGQLARLLGSRSRAGRVIDSLADHLVFISIYVHLALRYVSAGASPAVFLLALVAGISHGLQGAAADYYRITYLHFVRQRSIADLDSSARLRSDYDQFRWSDRPWQKLLLALYLNFMRQQELLSPRLKRLREICSRSYAEKVPEWFRLRYERLAQPMFKLWGLLMTNTRMLILFVLLFIGRPIWYFWIEITLFNVLLAGLLYRQEKMSQSLIALATAA
jgi:hypothetical protein